MRLKQTSGPFVITVFTSPEPMRAGPADLSVLVQDPGAGEPILDAAITIRLRPPDAANAAEQPIAVAATHAQATNKLLYAAAVDLPQPGTWALRVEVRRGTESAAVGCDLAVAAGAPPLRRIWPYLVVPPVAILLFALHQWLAHGHITGREGI